jgi:hypothetical protein
MALKRKIHLTKIAATRHRPAKASGGKFAKRRAGRKRLHKVIVPAVAGVMPAPSAHLLSSERSRLQALLEACYKYFDDLILGDLQKVISKNIFSTPPDPPSGPIFLTALTALSRYLVDTNRDPDRLIHISTIINTFASEIKKRMGDRVEYGGIHFETIAQIKQAYWSAKEGHRVRERAEQEAAWQTSCEIIRINEVPFAESVFTKLMQGHHGELGYVIQVVNIKWSEVGNALRTNRIDVALYNGAIKSQLAGIAHRFNDRKLIFPSHKLYRYKKYPVLASTLKGVPMKISVPFNSDFEFVIRENVRRGKLVLPDRRRLAFSYDIFFSDSADAALADVVDGRAKYCIVGGLQEHYAIKEFGKSASPVHIKRIGYMDRRNNKDDAFARFWVAADRREEGKDIIDAIVAIWNHSVVQEWSRIANPTDPDKKVLHEELIEFINARKHLAFISNFNVLSDLIRNHDDALKQVDLGIDESVKGLN